MPSAANIAFSENSKDVLELWSIRQGLTPPGLARKASVVNRTAVIFITACWESYIEDLAFEAFEFLLTNAATSAAIPIKVRTLATKSIFAQKDASKVWDIADSGWRTLLVAHKADIKTNWLGNFNTPKTPQVNGLYNELLGIGRLSDKWYWAGMSAKNAGDKLDEYISIRGDIVHRLTHAETVYKHWGKDYLGHISKIVKCCEVAVSEHIRQAVGTTP